MDDIVIIKVLEDIFVDPETIQEGAIGIIKYGRKIFFNNKVINLPKGVELKYTVYDYEEDFFEGKIKIFTKEEMEMKPQKLEININIVISPPGKEAENSIYDVVTRNQVILDVQEEVKRRIEENVPEWGRCTPVIAHKAHKVSLSD